MNWSGVKNMLIAILVAANLFLIFNIVKQDRTRGYIEPEEVAGATELLSMRGLLVDADIVPLKKFREPVYESRYNDEYYTEVAETVTGSKREMLVSLPNGGFSITASNGAIVEFDTEFGFSYAKYDKTNTNAYTDITADSFGGLSDKGQSIPGSRLKLLSKEAKSFLDARVPADYVLCAEITDGFDDPKSGLTYLLASQTLGGHDVYSHYAVCVFDGEELIGAHGRWYFAPFDADYNTQLIDQVNILFHDLSTLRSYSVDAASLDSDDVVYDGSESSSVSEDSEVHTSSVNLPESQVLPAIFSIKSCYTTYWSADKTAVYFIPAWHIAHDNGMSIVYNATNGTVYANN